MGAARIERMTQRHYSRNEVLRRARHEKDQVSVTATSRNLNRLLHDDRERGKADEQQRQEEEHIGERHHHTLLVCE